MMLIIGGFGLIIVIILGGKTFVSLLTLHATQTTAVRSPSDVTLYGQTIVLFVSLGLRSRMYAA